MCSFADLGGRAVKATPRNTWISAYVPAARALLRPAAPPQIALPFEALPGKSKPAMSAMTDTGLAEELRLSQPSYSQCEANVCTCSTLLIFFRFC